MQYACVASQAMHEPLGQHTGTKSYNKQDGQRQDIFPQAASRLTEYDK